MHLEFGVTQEPAVMQSLKQSDLYEFSCAKNPRANQLPEPGWHTAAKNSSTKNNACKFVHISCSPLT